MFGATAAHAEPVRILIAAGHRLGLEAEQPLKYADSDASRVRDVMVTLGGVRPENAAVLKEPSRAALFQAIDQARTIAAKHRPDEVTLLFYFSGHGDRDAFHLGDERVLMSDVTSKLAEVPASLRITVSDACRTNRDKGFVADAPFSISATNASEASGQVWLHASRDGEAAQESDDLHGAIFTHAWLNGLRGAADSNGDARVTLDESFAFARSQTLIRSTKSSGVVQKPEAVVSLHELSPVVLTETGSNVAKISLPPARDTHFLVYSTASKTVVSELWGLPDRRIVIALPAGHYSVQRRVAGSGASAQFALAAGDDRILESTDFSSSVLSPLAAKGTDPNADADAGASLEPPRKPWEVSAGYDIGADRRTGMVQGPRLSGAWSFDQRSRFAVVLGTGVDLSDRSLAATSEKITTGFGRAGLELRIPVGALALHVGVGGRAGLLSQRLEPNKGSASTHGAFAGGPDVSLVLRANLGKTLFADVGAVGNVLFLQEEEKPRGILGAAGSIALGVRF